MTTWTVSSATELLSALSSASGGDQILLQNGNYGTLNFANKTFSSDVTIKAIHAGGATFSDIDFQGSSHFKLDGLVVQNQVQATAGSSYLTYVNSVFEDGVYFRDASHITVGNNDITGGTFGLILNEVQHFQVTDNYIHEVQIDLMRVTGDSYDGLIQNNSLIDTISAPGDHTDALQFFGTNGNTPHDITIRGNYIYDDPTTGDPGRYMQGIFIKDDAGGGYKNFLIEDNLIAVGSPNSIYVSNGVSNIVIRDNSFLSWEAGGGGATIRLLGDSSGVTVDGNVLRVISQEGTGAHVGDNLIYSNDPSSPLYWGKLFEGTGESWQGFIPKDGSPIDSSSHYGALARLAELLGGGTSSGSGSSTGGAPDAANDVATTKEDTPVTVSVLANDSDPNGDALIVTDASATHGTVKVNTNGTITYTPSANFNGQDTVTYSISDGKGGTDSATVAVTVTPVNDAPVTKDDAGVSHSPVTIDVLANDSDPDNDTLTVVKAIAPNGTVVINSDQTVTYNPNPGFQGQDIITYTVSDGHGGTATGKAVITVDPTGTTDGGSSSSGSSATEQVITVTVSGDQYNGDPRFRLLVDGQQVGDIQSVSAVHSSGEWQTFKFTVDASGGFDQVSVQFVNDTYGGSADKDRNLYVDSIGVNGVELAPQEAVYDRAGKSDIAGQSTMAWAGALVFDVSNRSDLFDHAPLANDDTASTKEDTSVTIVVLANDADPSGGQLTVTEASADHGTIKVNDDGTITYTPNANFNGDDAIIYKVADDHGGTDSATVAVTVTPVNDAPVAHNDVATTHSPVTIDVLANDSDPDNDVLSVIAATAHDGTVVINDDQTLTYNPNAGFTGQDTLTYTISDGHGGNASATVAVTVPGDGSSSASSEQVISVTVSGDQYNGEPQFRLMVDGQQVGDVQSVSAVHSSGDWQTFKFTVDAPGGFDQLQVQFLNDAYGGHGMDRNLYVASVDVNGSELAPSDAVYDRVGKSDIAGQSTMAWGGALVFDTSNRGDLFDNAAPVAADDTAGTAANTAVVIAALANDSDPNGDSLLISDFTQADHGTVAHNDDGTFTYTPDAGFTGVDTFDYTLTDGALADAATVTVHVGDGWIIS
jgi:Bacterial Ig domain/Ca-dependent carbohydrate-binding module xylan-binding/Right handed beta helix region